MSGAFSGSTSDAGGRSTSRVITVPDSGNSSAEFGGRGPFTPRRRGSKARRVPDRLNWPQDRRRPDPRSVSGAGLTRAASCPLAWPHELPDPGISHQFSSSSPDPGKSHRLGGSSPPSDTIGKPKLHGLYSCFYDLPSRVIGQLEA